MLWCYPCRVGMRLDDSLPENSEWANLVMDKDLKVKMFLMNYLFWVLHHMDWGVKLRL